MNNTENKNLMNNIMKFTEHINLNQAKDIVSLNYDDFVLKFKCKEWEDHDGSNKYSSKTYFNQCIRWLKKVIKLNKSSYHQKYKYSKNQTNGRIYVRGFGIQSVPKLIKNYLLDKIELYDYDMINAHFVILDYLCKKHDIKNNFLNTYVMKRQEVLESGGITKLDMILFLYNDKHINKNISEKCYNEISYVKKQINKLEKHLINDITTKSKNPESALLSKILGYYENEILQKVINQYECNVPYYDGFISNQKIPIEKLNELTKEYGVKWSIKSLKNEISLEDEDKKAIRMVDEYITFFENASEYQIAEHFLKSLPEKEKGKWIYFQGDKKGYYYTYNENNIIKPSQSIPLSLLKRLSTLYQELNIKVSTAASMYHGQLTKESVAIDNQLLKINTQMGKNSFKKSIVEELKLLINNQEFVDKIDANNDIIAFKDKVYDFKKEEFRPIRKDDYIMNHLDYNAPIENIDVMNDVEKLINSIFDDEPLRKYFYDSITYSLFTNRFEKFNIWTGCGSNGKGILLSLLEKTLGSYMKQPNSQFLTSSVEGANSSLIQCKGKKLVMVAEPENDKNGNLKFNTNFIKKLTGRDTISGRLLYQDEISFRPNFTLFCQCNQIPSIESVDNAIKRRFVILPFKNKFVCKEDLREDRPNYKLRDNTLKDRINSDEEFYKQFMMLLIKYSKGLYNKTLQVPKECEDFLNEYMNTNDVVNEFLEDTFIMIDPNDTKYKTNMLKLNDIFTDFKNHDSYNNMKKREFRYNLLLNENIKHGRNNKGLRGIFGLIYRRNDEDEDNSLISQF